MVQHNSFIDGIGLTETNSLIHLLDNNDTDDNNEAPIIKHYAYYDENEFSTMLANKAGLSILSGNVQYINAKFDEFQSFVSRAGADWEWKSHLPCNKLGAPFRKFKSQLQWHISMTFRGGGYMRCISYSLTLIATGLRRYAISRKCFKMEPFGVYFDKICLTYLQRAFIFYM